MKQTPQSFKKDVTEFIDNFNKFKTIVYEQSNINRDEIVPLFKIFLDQI